MSWAEQPLGAARGSTGASPKGAQAICAEPSRGAACAAVWHVAAAERAMSCGSVGSKCGSQSGSGRGLGRGLQKATGPRLILGLDLLGWAASVWIAGQLGWTVGLVSGWFNWTVASGLVWSFGHCSRAGSKAEAEVKNGLALPDFGFGLIRILGCRLPYPTSADFSASFLSPSRGVSVADFGPLSSFSSLFLVLLSFLGVLRPKSS